MFRTDWVSYSPPMNTWTATAQALIRTASSIPTAICAGVGAGVYSGLTDPRPGLRRRAATFEPDRAVAAAYDQRYPAWREIYQRVLDITEDGLLNPLWRAAGA